ncbi:copper chaperone PCu(A)C [Achromobacter insolitus]|jgi:copper(I)-binding protein|uniref:Copper chaperone PCu(A)C n=1 Tax=Achromobacter insolitus TaxID=217204 RepID=A0A6S7F5Y1_9BURK|nr:MULTISPECIES: copper chaperone PCu(A)C [Achromobacter]AVG40968.1 copper chaperone PCu(A)C [Achromobacter insolitus]AXA71658.1 transporter [Achromobacter insolitus]MEB3099580.1 copper chaperone PCu(A)C [Achromobacter sp. D10]OAD12527.1 transporter [Achromobacter insolitus]OAE51191.1 transporter [Achromobacter insolitus]
MKKIAIKSLAAAAFAFCALAGANHVALAQDAGLKVDDAWVRATVPSQHATGVFMRLTSNAAGRLVGVESQAAKHVEIHEMAMQDNVMKMRQVPGIDLPAGQPVELKPGGYHVMLIDLAGQIAAGDHVALTLIVEDAARNQRRVPVDAVARPLNAGAAPAAGHGHGH